MTEERNVEALILAWEIGRYVILFDGTDNVDGDDMYVFYTSV